MGREGFPEAFFSSSNYQSDDAIRLSPNISKAWNRKAVILESLGIFKEAGFLTKAIY